MLSLGWCTPGVCPRGIPLGYPTTSDSMPIPHPAPPRRTARRAGTGLWAQGGSQGAGRAGFAGPTGRLLLYPRPFPPGQSEPPTAVLTNDWIGSRSRPAQAGLDVQDLVGLSIGLAGSSIGRFSGRLRTVGGIRRLPPQPPIESGLIRPVPSVRPVPFPSRSRPSRPGTGRSRFRTVSNTTWFGDSCSLKAQEHGFLALQGQKDAILHYLVQDGRNGTGRNGTGRTDS